MESTSGGRSRVAAGRRPQGRLNQVQERSKNPGSQQVVGPDRYFGPMENLSTEKASTNQTSFNCLTCGACCAFSDTWPQLQLDESDASPIPEEMIDWENLRMKCKGDRCVALEGVVGQRSSCKIYQRRPVVCREFAPGTKGCLAARSWFGLPPT
jgi:uncharacterized protein